MRLGDVAANYDRAARRYDLWNGLVFDRLLGIERLRERTVERLGDVRGGRVLDIACGTGLNLPYLVERVGGGGEIVGVDYSEGMLEQARRRVARHGWRNVRLVRGDAAVLEDVEGPFDGVVSTWALGIVHDLDAALRRAVELLGEDGRLAVLDFDKTRPDRGLQRWLSPLYHRVLLASGVDTPEDLDDGALRARWSRGKAFLRERLVEVVEEPYFHGAGFLLSGRLAEGPPAGYRRATTAGPETSCTNRCCPWSVPSRFSS